MKLWTKIFIGLVLGVLAGLIFQEKAVMIKPLGTLFINAIKMLIVPLIFSSLIVGMTSMQDTKQLGRIGIKTIIIYLCTTAVAVSIGLLVSNFIQPGAGMHIDLNHQFAVKQAPQFVDTLVNIVPKNPIEALSSGKMLQIIVFAICIGIAINITGKKAAPAKQFAESIAEIMYTLTAIVMKAAPYGVFALMAYVVGQYGMQTLLPLAKVILAVYIGAILQIVFVYGMGITVVGKLNPIRFFKGILDAQMVAFTTTSSSGTLPATIKCTHENLGVSKNVSSFVLPLGATINMDGTAIYQGVCAVFVAQACGIELTMANYITLILASTLASIGTAGVPGAGLIMLSVTLSSIGLPMEGIAIIAGIDRVLDMARTTVNVTGDAMVSVLVGKSEKEFDESCYYSDKLTTTVLPANESA
ncbi:MAG: dicarboxylate/amino acid:cation symporter [Desulfobacteraceae bacterium]|nr:dicarboxylate/amino acid:cation symporter [Desulfobacteraceae bacterium]